MYKSIKRYLIIMRHIKDCAWLINTLFFLSLYIYINESEIQKKITVPVYRMKTVRLRKKNPFNLLPITSTKRRKRKKGFRFTLFLRFRFFLSLHNPFTVVPVPFFLYRVESWDPHFLWLVFELSFFFLIRLSIRKEVVD